LIVRQNHKLDRLLWRVGLSWWQRQQYRLWLHFLPHRLGCRVLGHQWGGNGPVITSGPLHVPPVERDYHLLAVHKQCARCATVRNVDFDTSTEALYLQEAQMEDESEWADPAIRAAMEQLGL
jgi:hypothetical protein